MANQIFFSIIKSASSEKNTFGPQVFLALILQLLTSIHIRPQAKFPPGLQLNLLEYKTKLNIAKMATFQIIHTAIFAPPKCLCWSCPYVEASRKVIRFASLWNQNFIWIELNACLAALVVIVWPRRRLGLVCLDDFVRGRSRATPMNPPSQCSGAKGSTHKHRKNKTFETQHWSAD